MLTQTVNGTRSSLRHAAVAVLLFVAGCESPGAAKPAGGAIQADSSAGPLRVFTVADGLEHPWGLAFLPDGRMLVTERPGRLRIVSADGKLSAPLGGVPAVKAAGQGGLLDVVLDPGFADNRRIYLSYAEPRDGSKSATAVARARLGATGLEDVKVIFRQQPAVDSAGHFGSRLVFRRDGTLFVGLGDRQRSQFRGMAQNRDAHVGKVVRIDVDGNVPADNPFVKVAGTLPETWSLGHRNIQGAALHPETGELWATEHGPRGGDELNVVRPGRNYGWPIVTWGIEYTGGKIGEGKGPGFEQPVHYWTPSIGASGFTFYTGDRYPGWRGSVFAGGLALRVLERLELDGERVVKRETLLEEVRERIRDVRQGPDGLLYLLTDDPKGSILRLEPAR